MVRLAFLHAALALALLEPGVDAQSHAEEQSINGPISMPNLGRGFSLGALYDARTDSRIAGYLWPVQVLRSSKYTQQVSAVKAMYSMVRDDTYKDKATLLGISAELALKARASTHAGGSKSKAEFKLGGSAQFMSKTKSSSKEVRMSVAFKLRSFQKLLDVFHPEVKRGLHSKVIADGRATHVVAGVTYGSDCIATFGYKTTSLKEKQVARAFLETKMSALGQASLPFNVASASAETSMETSMRMRYESMGMSTAAGFTVDITGDVMPDTNDTLPTDVEAAIDFLQRVHEHGTGDGGVPMDLALIPLSWLDTTAAKVERRIEGDKLEEAMKIIVELDTSMETLNDLLEVEMDGFMAWGREVQEEIKALEIYSNTFTQQLSDAIDIFRNGSDTSLLTQAFASHYRSSFHAAAIQALAERRRDQILGLKALVRSVKRQAQVQIAEQFSDYMAPSLNQQYDEVYMLVVTGMDPATQRSSMTLVKDFTAYASALLSSSRPVTWCETVSHNGEDVCMRHFYFGLIHFDSFCEQFCPETYCRPMPRRCTDPAASATLAFGSSAWCQNPCSMIVGFSGNGAPYRADSSIIVVPGPPSIVNVTGAGDVQRDPFKQQVTLRVQPSSRGSAMNYRVRVAWLERTRTASGSGWAQKQRVFDTRDDATDIEVRKLTAGVKYTFQVAGISFAGVGPFSEEYRTPDGTMLKVAHTMTVIKPEEDFSIPRNDSGPSWKPFRYVVSLSVPAGDPLGQVTFRSPAGDVSFDCEEYRNATTTSVSCLVAHPSVVAQDTVYEVIVRNMDGDEVQGRGSFTFEALTGQSCYNTNEELRVLCSASRVCVRSCAECTEKAADLFTGQLRMMDTALVQASKSCEVDVCPDDGAFKMSGCPTSNTSFLCFYSRATDEDCRYTCNGESSYIPERDLCALSCTLDLSPTGLRQACSRLSPGQSCTIDCLDNYAYTPVNFTCPRANVQAHYYLGHPNLALPVCQPMCPIFACPVGWQKKANAAALTGTTRDQCCDEIVCTNGKYGPDLSPSCQTCNGEARRRRASFCTSCPTGYAAKAGSDNCVPFCNTVSCQANWVEKTNKATLTGSTWQDCCLPGCTAVSCPTGWNEKHNKASLDFTDHTGCCDKIVCPAGSWLDGNTCRTCNGATRRRDATSCTACASGYINRANSDDCAPYCSTVSCPSGWWEKSNKATLAGSHYTHCCNEVTCPGGYYTRRRAASCDYCSGTTRRRRATSCSGCAMNYVNRHGHDDCTKRTSVSGYSIRADCTSGSNLEHTNNREITWCAARCTGWKAGRWWVPDCIGFNFNFHKNQCALKQSCHQHGGSPNLNSWHHYRKR